MSKREPRWDPTTFALAYQVGEFTLWRKSFPALSLNANYFDLTSDPRAPAPPFERFGKDVAVIVTRSHPIRAPLPSLTREDGVLCYARSQYSRFHTDLGGSFEAYLNGFSSKSRSTLRRKVRRFKEHEAKWGFRVYRHPEEMGGFLDLARKVSALTYQEKLLHAGIPDSEAYRDELVALAEKDSVRAYVLLLGGAPIAYLCCPADEGTLFYGYLGYDPSFAELSPGTVLQYLAFESLFAEGRFTVFDFTEGQGEHKRFFGTHETLCADICYFPATPRMRFWVGFHIVLTGASSTIVRLLDRAGLKSRIKNFLRRH